jgi:hypothetical protein
MSKKSSNRKLLYILGILVVILLFTFLKKIPGERATLKSTLIELDTASIGKIRIYPKAENGAEIDFTKDSSGWIIKKGGVTARAREGVVASALNELIGLKPERLASNDKSKWKEYELTDSLATRVRVSDKKDKTLAEVLVGKISFNQGQNMYGQGDFKGTSYVRLPDDKDVYAIDGFLSFTFNRKFNDWRENKILELNKNEIKKITYSYPADSSYDLTLKDSTWFAGDVKTDSLNTANYLNSLGRLSGQDFKDGFVPAGEPLYKAVFEGKNANFTVKCFKGESPDDFIINSSLNPDLFFSSKRGGLFGEIFKPLSYFVKKK